jgi:Protein of unknown function (DUF2877)
MVSGAVPVPAVVRVPAEEPVHRFDPLTAVHVGQSALVLSGTDDDTGPLLVVTDARRGLVPFGLCVPHRRDFAAVRAAVAGVRGPLDLSGWRWVRRAFVDLRLSPATVDPAALQVLNRALAAESHHRTGPNDPSPQRRLGDPLTRAALRRDEARVASALAELVGAGPGATPAGDDVVVGVLAALALLAGSDTRVPPARRLLVTALAPLLGRTTRASRQDLAAAAAGRFAEHTHVLASALRGSGDVRRVISAARAWGATSGIDLAWGMCAAVSAVLDQHCGVRLLDAHLLDGRPA